MKRQLTGKVISDKMHKTIVVSVQQFKEHPKYHKRYRVSKKYKAHDQNSEFKAGDVVIIEECRPMSADKRWKAVKKVIIGADEAAAVVVEKEGKEAD